MTCSILSANQRDAEQPAGDLFLRFSTARQSSLRRSSQRSPRRSPAFGGASTARIRLVVCCSETKMRAWRAARRSIKQDTAKSLISTTMRARLFRTPRRNRREEVWQPLITDDLPDRIPITEVELDILEAHFADLLDELFGARR
jgi:hypothetical protein